MFSSATLSRFRTLLFRKLLFRGIFFAALLPASFLGSPKCGIEPVCAFSRDMLNVLSDAAVLISRPIALF